MESNTPTRTTRAKAPKFFGGWSNAPITTQADAFELTRLEIEKEFVLLNDAQVIKYVTAIAEDSEFSNDDRDEAYSRLHRAHAPLALQAAVAATKKQSSPGLEVAYSCAMISLWKVIKRWDPTKGIKLSSFVSLMLPIELGREIREEELVNRNEWKRISVSKTVETILSQAGNQPYLTWYADAQLEFTAKNLMAFPDHTSVTSIITVHGARMTLRTPDFTERQDVIKGKLKVIKVPVVNPMLTWITESKALTVKIFSTQRFNKPRTDHRKRAQTGFKIQEMLDARLELHSQLQSHPKLTSTFMKSRIFARPARPLRRDDITPRMIQDAMRKHRREIDSAFDEKAWSIFQIAELMNELYNVVSLDAPVSSDTEQHATLADFMAAPELFDADDEILEDEFDVDELTDASEIVASLQKSGLWEVALQMPLHKFLNAHRAHRAGFCILCSRYGLRVKHALQVVQVIEAHLR